MIPDPLFKERRQKLQRHTSAVLDERSWGSSDKSDLTQVVVPYALRAQYSDPGEICKEDFIQDSGDGCQDCHCGSLSSTSNSWAVPIKGQSEGSWMESH
jgi:hypothetical protein